MAKKTLDDFYGPGVLSGRGTPLPHMAGYATQGAEGPKRLMKPTGSRRAITSTKPKYNGAEGPKRSMPLYRDKYGRRISAEEYGRRESFRQGRKNKTADTNEALRPGEMKRRKKYRKGEGTAQFGKGATTKTRNKDLALGVSSRYVNKKPAGDRAKYQK